MKKKFWVEIIPFDSELLTAAIEAGADAVVIPDGMVDTAHRIGRITTIAADGDLRLGSEVERIRIESRADEAKVSGSIPCIIDNSDWSIIPLENLISRVSGNLIQSVHSADEAKTALQVMERGADGILLTSRDINEIKRCGGLISEVSMEKINLEPATIRSIETVVMSDRCCIDTTSILTPGEGLLIGNSSSAQFLVHNENIETEHAAARPFRVNAGAVHAYVRLPDNRTAYLAEISAGSELLACDPHGNSRTIAAGRNKIERRPMLLITAVNETGKEVSLVMQNAETVRLTGINGEAMPATSLQPGDRVLASFSTQTGRHFGREIDETIREH